MNYSSNAQSRVETYRQNKKYAQRLSLSLLALLTLSSFYLLASSPASDTSSKPLLAIAIVWLGLLPSFQFLLNKDRSSIPFLPLVGLFYSTSFGLPIFVTDNRTHAWSLSGVSEQSLMLVVIGLLLMNISFYASRSTVWKHTTHIEILGGYSSKGMVKVSWLLLLAYLINLYIPAVRVLPSISQLLQPLGYISCGLFYILWLDGKVSKVQKWLLSVVFLPLYLLPLLASGSLAQVMLLTLFMLLVVWRVSQRIPFVLVAVLLSAYLFFSPVKIQYRYQAWSPNNNLGLFDKIELFWDLALDHHLSGNSKPTEVNSAVDRSAHIVLLSNVIKDTPSIAPFWNGETYVPLFSKFIPRALWPDKPSETVGNDFGRRYKYLGPADFSTSFNLPIIVEMYINFGETGIFLGMSLLGVLMAFLDKKFNGINMNSLEFLVGATCLFSLTYQESNFSLLFGQVILLSIALVWLLRNLAKKTARHSF